MDDDLRGQGAVHPPVEIWAWPFNPGWRGGYYRERNGARETEKEGHVYVLADFAQAVAVEVKPLVWEKISDRFYRAIYAPNQHYHIFDYADHGWTISHTVRGTGDIKLGLPDEAAAKAAAEADNRARTLSLINTRSVEEVRNESLLSAIHEVEECWVDWVKEAIEHQHHPVTSKFFEIRAEAAELILSAVNKLISPQP